MTQYWGVQLSQRMLCWQRFSRDAGAAAARRRRHRPLKRQGEAAPLLLR